MEDTLSKSASSQQRLARAPCANTTEVDGLKLNCDNEANLVCSQCSLVKYCGRDCQKAHWPVHKVKCKSDLREADWEPTWWREKREPTVDGFGESTPFDSFGTLRSLWGNIPSFDVLNLAKNEGADYGKDLALCFAASGDLRNLVESINTLPENYQGTCTCVLNDRDDVIVCRNIVLLLIAILLPPATAPEVMLHIWYSARLKPHMLRAMHEHITPLVADVMIRIKRKSKRDILSKTWTFGSRVVSARLYKDQWEVLLAMVSASHDLAETELNRRHIMLDAKRLDTRELHLYSLPPLRRPSATRMRQSGVLLPFGSCRDAFRVPNPTLFKPGSSQWLAKDTSDPINSWPIKAVLGAGAKYGVPPEDLYGHLHFHIRDKLDAFCHKLSASASATTPLRLHLHLYSIDATALPRFLSPALKFDRIDASTLADGDPEEGDQRPHPHRPGLPATLLALSPFLQPRSANPHAALLTLFADAVPAAERSLGLDYIAKTSRTVFRRATRFVDFPAPAFQPRHPRYMRVMRAKDSFRDFDRLFAHFAGAGSFERAGKAAGVKVREGKNAVVPEWPFRLAKRAGEKGAGEAFALLEASPLVGCERFVEWVREG